MGYDMYLLKAKRQSVEEILDKYYEKCIDNLQFDAFEELEKKSGSILFESRMNVFKDIEDKLPYAHEKYVYLTRENYELISSHCRDKIAQYQSENVSKDEWEYGWYENLLCWLQSFVPDWDNDVIIYEHDC